MQRNDTAANEACDKGSDLPRTRKPFASSQNLVALDLAVDGKAVKKSTFSFPTMVRLSMLFCDLGSMVLAVFFPRDTQKSAFLL